MAYYSCFRQIYQPKQMAVFSGPSGIRTHDLLNAIETRSQLRYGPSLFGCFPGIPEEGQRGL